MLNPFASAPSTVSSSLPRAVAARLARAVAATRDERPGARFRPSICMENLERRQLLSGVVNGQLYLDTPPLASNITIQLVAGNSNLLKVRGDGPVQTFTLSGVTQINLAGSPGNDSIALSDIHGQIPVPALINGGAGDDTLVGSTSGHDTLLGGSQADMLISNGPGDSLDGGKGADTLSGGSSDVLNAGPGENLLSDNSGANFSIVAPTPTPPVVLPAAASNINLSYDGIINPFNAGYTPEQVRNGYELGLLSQPGTTLLGQGQTIAIVDAFDNPNALADLTDFSQTYGLPLPTPQTFEEVYSAGVQPAASAADGGETALDIEWAHAIAPDAKIILVEAPDFTTSGIFNAVAVAANLVSKSSSGGGVVSMSFGMAEASLGTDATIAAVEYSVDRMFASYPNISFIAASGDTAGEKSYPAMSPYVTSVGGTTDHFGTDGVRIAASTYWTGPAVGEGGGGGISLNEPEPLYQQGTIGELGFVTGSTTIAARVGPDVSMLANPSTGVEVIDISPDQFGVSGPQEVGGTSLAAPLFAAVVALGNQRRAIPSAQFPNGQAPIGDELNSAIYTINSYEPGRDFSLGTATGYTQTTGWGEPIVPNFTSDLSLLNLNGSDVGSAPVNDYVNLDNVIFDATQYGDINIPISGSQLAIDSYTGTGTALSTGPTTFVITLNGVDDIGLDAAPVAISLTSTVTVDPGTGQFSNLNTLDTIDAAKFVTIPTPLQPGQTLAIYFEGSLSVGSNGEVNAIDGDFYAAIVDINTGTIQKIGTNGINGSGDGDVRGNFEPN